MIVDGKRLAEGERLRLLADMERGAEVSPVQQELPLEPSGLGEDDRRYLWKDEQERAPVGRGCLIAIGFSAAFWVLLAALVFA